MRIPRDTGMGGLLAGASRDLAGARLQRSDGTGLTSLRPHTQIAAAIVNTLAAAR